MSDNLYDCKKIALDILLELKREKGDTIYIVDDEGNKYSLQDAIDRLRDTILRETLKAKDLKNENTIIKKRNFALGKVE